MLLNFEAEAKSLRPRPKGPEAEAEMRGYETETEAKILASRPVWPGGFNISVYVGNRPLYRSANQTNSAFHPFGIDKLVSCK